MSKRKVLLDELREYIGDPNWHPAFHIADLLRDPCVEDNLRLRAAEILLPYTAPKLKHLEVSGSVDHRVGMLRISTEKTKEVERLKQIRDASPSPLLEDGPVRELKPVLVK